MSIQQIISELEEMESDGVLDKHREKNKTLLAAIEIIKKHTDGMAFHPITPAKGEPMPKTQEYWDKRAAMDQELILEQKAEISRLKMKVNNREQRK